jgi:hypothetical protein
VVLRQEQPFTDREALEVEGGRLVEWESGVLSRNVPPIFWERDPESTDSWGCGWSWPVSERALTAWAEREGLDPVRVVGWARERWPRRRRRRSPPPPVKYANPEERADLDQILASKTMNRRASTR